MALVGLTVASVALADGSGAGPIFAITEENDLFIWPLGPKSDRHYTQGLKLTYFAGEDEMRRSAEWWNTHLPAVAFPKDNSQTRVGFAFGQNMYTPQNIAARNPSPRDQPYCAWLYLGAMFQRRGIGANDIPVMEHFEMDLGLIGPPALGEQAQKFVHRYVSGSVQPEGWDYQLQSEPALLMKYNRAWRLTPVKAAEKNLDLIPHVGINLGNVRVSGEVGTMLRAGWNLPDDFGITTINSTAGNTGGLTAQSPSCGAHVFAGAKGEVIGQDIFLEGNTGRASRSVTPEPMIGEFSWGLALRVARHFDLAYTWVMRSQTFETQRTRDFYGSFTFRGLFTY